MIQKKGQAAMEFLMTYGWALLVVLIAIGALAFFGVLNPSKFLPNSCTLTPGFACNDFKAAASDDVITIVIQNGLGDNLNSVSLNLLNSNPSCDGAFTQTTGTNATLNDGASATFTLDCTASSDLILGSKLKGDLQIGYIIGSGSNNISHAKVGQLVVGVEA
ncbi:MAG TPA: hypothetical protein VJH37_01620 [Candidatus Nanoarchaeia archaeon]|nr:hypothetical protein [Candidatus Nanoarchaeia archaeon]